MPDGGGIFGFGLLPDTTRFLYRGTTFAAASGMELRDQERRGEEITILRGRMSVDDMQSDLPGLDPLVDDLDLEDRARDRVPVTGGLTRRLGTAVHFSHSPIPAPGLPLVLFYDRDRIRTPLQDVRYEYEWFNQHPAALGHVDNFATRELRINGQLWGLAGFKAGTGAIVSSWGIDELRRESRQEEEEQEVIALQDSIDLSGALAASATITHQPRSRLEKGARTNPKNLTRIQVLQALHDHVVNRSPIRLDNHIVIQLDSAANRTRDHIDPDKLDTAYTTNGPLNPDDIPEVFLGR